MAGGIRALASQTAVYGLSSMVGRFINFLLVPLYTARLAGVSDYGVVSVMFSYAAFLGVLYTYGMETAFFNFARREPKPEQVFATGLRALFISSLGFSLIALLFAPFLADWAGYPDHPEYVVLFAGILAADALAALPFAWLRFREKAFRFAFIRLSGILLNVAINLFCLLALPDLARQGWVDVAWVKPEALVLYIFLSNLIASFAVLLLLLPELRLAISGWNKLLFREMFRYAAPLIWVGLAGMVNETLDRILLKQLLDGAIADYEAGLYSAFYKMAMVLSIFVQAFRFAAEPFFFSRSNEKDAPALYARVMRIFIWVVAGMGLATLCFADFIAPLLLRRAAYFADPRGMAIVPVLLLANLLLGVYYNLSIWYKLSGQTKLGARVAIGGAMATLLLNMVLIPHFSFVASAWITLAVYAGMVVASWYLGRRWYPVPYHYGNAFLALALAVLAWLAFRTAGFAATDGWEYWFVGMALLLAYGGIAFLSEKKKWLWKSSV
jgi:O-antigen/teichoic acid export membrane protein